MIFDICGTRSYLFELGSSFYSNFIRVYSLEGLLKGESEERDTSIRKYLLLFLALSLSEKVVT